MMFGISMVLMKQTEFQDNNYGRGGFNQDYVLGDAKMVLC
jgi:hypothetical protein